MTHDVETGLISECENVHGSVVSDGNREILLVAVDRDGYSRAKQAWANALRDLCACGGSIERANRTVWKGDLHVELRLDANGPMALSELVRSG